MKKAFTLVELLIVIAIIGILMAVILPNFVGGRESARAAVCLANMKNLGNACQVYGMAESFYPRAGSCEELVPKSAKNIKKSVSYYYELPGWISWYSKGNYPNGSRTSPASNPLVGLYEAEGEKTRYALEHGTIWSYVGRNSKTYVCPSHVKAMNEKKTRPHWSYLMNVYFGKNFTKPIPKSGADTIRYRSSVVRSDRRLLFAEIPFMGYSSWNPTGSGASADTDAVLQYNAGETIGANHISGKTLYAHVCYADGHTEKLKIPYTGKIKSPRADETQLKNLTTWLCEGSDVSFDGNKNYQKMN